MMGISRWKNRLIDDQVSIAPLVTFRIVFGAVMFLSTMRFWSYGWIEEQYINPAFHFKYFGFSWVPDFSTEVIYFLFACMAISALGIALGALYRFSTLIFFLSFTTVELIDATYYLNHYYFVSVVSAILLFLPAHQKFSLDVKWGFTSSRNQSPALYVNILKLQLALVYFLAGVAKVNSDWLLEAMPLIIWLPAQDQLPIIGGIFGWKPLAYIMSWAGAFYDLFIPFLLLSARWRWFGYVGVVIFHLMTWSLFQIGMFPFIMIGATLIFFSSDFHDKLHHLFGFREKRVEGKAARKIHPQVIALVSIFFLFQLIFPFRYLLYPGNPYWTEQGYRFGWRVMLVEKAGYAQFKVNTPEGRSLWVENRDFLTPVQEKMMSTQSDFMLQFAAHLQEYFEQKGMEVSGVHADVFVTYNGRSSKRFIDPSFDLAAAMDSWEPKSWIIPLNDDHR